MYVSTPLYDNLIPSLPKGASLAHLSVRAFCGVPFYARLKWSPQKTLRQEFADNQGRGRAAAPLIPPLINSPSLLSNTRSLAPFFFSFFFPPLEGTMQDPYRTRGTDSLIPQTHGCQGQTQTRCALTQGWHTTQGLALQIGIQGP